MDAALPAMRLAVRLPLFLLPAVAYAAAQATLAVDAGSTRFWVALVAVQVLAAFGYAASSLPEWAQWVDDTGGAVAIAERRLKIVQGFMIALLAGNIAYYGGFYYFAIAEIPSFIAGAVAAYGGDKFLSPLLSRITGKVEAS